MAKIGIDISDDLERKLKEIADDRFNGDMDQVVVVALKWWVDEQE